MPVHARTHMLMITHLAKPCSCAHSPKPQARQVRPSSCKSTGLCQHGSARCGSGASTRACCQGAQRTSQGEGTGEYTGDVLLSFQSSQLQHGMVWYGNIIGISQSMGNMVVEAHSVHGASGGIFSSTASGGVATWLSKALAK